MSKTDLIIFLLKSVSPSGFSFFVVVKRHIIYPVAQAKNHRILPWLCFSIIISIPKLPESCLTEQKHNFLGLYTTCLLMKPILVFTFRLPHHIQLIWLSSQPPITLSPSHLKYEITFFHILCMYNWFHAFRYIISPFPLFYFISFDLAYHRLIILASSRIFIFSFIHAYNLRTWSLQDDSCKVLSIVPGT